MFGYYLSLVLRSLRQNIALTALMIIAVLVLGQLAVLWPALRAASVPPAAATRSF